MGRFFRRRAHFYQSSMMRLILTVALVMFCSAHEKLGSDKVLSAKDFLNVSHSEEMSLQERIKQTSVVVSNGGTCGSGDISQLWCMMITSVPDDFCEITKGPYGNNCPQNIDTMGQGNTDGLCISMQEWRSYKNSSDAQGQLVVH